MNRRGRHASRSGVGRDIGIMVAGVIVVGALVYGALWGYTAVFGGDDPGEASAPSSTTTSVLSDTTAGPTSDTTEPAQKAAPDTTVAASDTTASTITPRQPSEIVVLVLNSVGTAGLAAEVSSELEELGYDVLEPDDYEPELERSQILFRDDFGPEAFELAAVVPDAEIALNPDPGEADIVVLIGSSYDG